MSQLVKLMDGILFPDWALCLHEYGDDEGLNKEDIQEYSTWYARILCQCLSMGYSNINIYVDPMDDLGFCYYPAFGLATNCYGCTVYGTK